MRPLVYVFCRESRKSSRTLAGTSRLTYVLLRDCESLVRLFYVKKILRINQIASELWFVSLKRCKNHQLFPSKFRLLNRHGAGVNNFSNSVSTNRTSLLGRFTWSRGSLHFPNGLLTLPSSTLHVPATPTRGCFLLDSTRYGQHARVCSAWVPCTCTCPRVCTVAMFRRRERGMSEENCPIR